jgi:hypothetical protein
MRGGVRNGVERLRGSAGAPYSRADPRALDRSSRLAGGPDAFSAGDVDGRRWPGAGLKQTEVAL